MGYEVSVDRSDAIRKEPGVAHGVKVAALYARYFDDVWRWLDALGVQHRDLEDGVHEVFLAVHKALGTFEGRSKISTWLFGITLRVASNLRRKAYTRREILDETLDRREGGGVDAEEAASREEARSQLHALLETLDEPRRVIFVLYELDGMTGTAISDLLGIPSATVYARLDSARRWFALATAAMNSDKEPSP